MTRRSGRSGARLACVWRRRHARWLAGLACGCSGRPPRLRARDSAPERPGGRAPACASSTTAVCPELQNHSRVECGQLVYYGCYMTVIHCP